MLRKMFILYVYSEVQDMKCLTYEMPLILRGIGFRYISDFIGVTK